jgi:hypothetical protein
METLCTDQWERKINKVDDNDDDDGKLLRMAYKGVKVETHRWNEE